MSAPTGCQPCPPTCGSVFDRVTVSYLIRNFTRVMWDLLPSFEDPGPYTFQLQYNPNANPYSGIWQDVGLPVVDQYFAVDDIQRVYGKTNNSFYRVLLATPACTYASEPTAAKGTLNDRDWRLAREVVRQRRVLYRYGPGAQLGYLLKRRWTGVPCPICVDPATGESRNPDCPTCYGTTFKCGYYYPVACVWATVSTRNYHTELADTRGTVKDVNVRAEMLMIDMLDEEDVWVNAVTDDRYSVHTVAHTAEMRGVPLIAEVELRLIPYSSAIYTIEIPQQLRDLGVPTSGASNPEVKGFGRGEPTCVAEDASYSDRWPQP